MDDEDSRGLLRSILRFLAGRSPQKSTLPTSLSSQARNAWVRTDAYLQHETNDFDDVEPESVARALRTFENLVQYDSDRESDPVSIAISWQFHYFNLSLPAKKNLRL